MLKIMISSNIMQIIATNFRKPIITSNISKRHIRQESKEDVNKPIYDMTDPFKKEKTKCILCSLNIVPDYKNVKLLSQFQSSFTGRIYGKHITGLCTAKQKKVELEIQKAQSAGLMGYYNKDVSFMKDPKLFDPENPIRPHKY